MARAQGNLRRSTTIIEVVMATIILSVGLPPLIGAMAEGAMQSRVPSNATIASFLATERMEQIVARHDVVHVEVEA